MIKIILNKLFGKRNVIVNKNTKENNGLIEDEVSSNKNSGYRNEVKEKYDFDLPASDTDKILLGNNFENAADIEKACACYEGCVKNRFKGNGPYDRLIILSLLSNYKSRNDNCLPRLPSGFSGFSY